MKFNELLLLAEAMDRRQFLKMLGRAGTVAGITPGAVGKMAINLATGDAASKDNLTNFISKYFLENPPFYANEDYGGWIESIDELDSVANSVNNAITPVINAFNGSGVNLPPHLLTLSRAIFDQVDEVKSMVEYSKLHPDEIPEELAIEEGESMLSSIFDADGVLGDFNKELLNFGFKTNRINPQTQKYLEDHYDVYKCDFVKDPESKARRDKKEAESKKRYEDYEKEEYKRQQQHTAKDINYSRMDTAGGSEDVGYAKYYEMKQNTDSRLIFEAYSKTAVLLEYNLKFLNQIVEKFFKQALTKANIEYNSPQAQTLKRNIEKDVKRFNMLTTGNSRDKFVVYVKGMTKNPQILKNPIDINNYNYGDLEKIVNEYTTKSEQKLEPSKKIQMRDDINNRFGQEGLAKFRTVRDDLYENIFSFKQNRYKLFKLMKNSFLAQAPLNIQKKQILKFIEKCLHHFIKQDAVKGDWWKDETEDEMRKLYSYSYRAITQLLDTATP